MGTVGGIGWGSLAGVLQTPAVWWDCCWLLYMSIVSVWAMASMQQPSREGPSVSSQPRIRLQPLASLPVVPALVPPRCGLPASPLYPPSSSTSELSAFNMLSPFSHPATDNSKYNLAMRFEDPTSLLPDIGTHWFCCIGRMQPVQYGSQQ